MCCFCYEDEPESIDNPVYIQPSAPAVGPPLPGVQTSTVNPVIYIERAQCLDFHFNRPFDASVFLIPKRRTRTSSWTEPVVLVLGGVSKTVST